MMSESVETGKQKEHRIWFPVNPCNKLACYKYLLSLGGCNKICGTNMDNTGQERFEDGDIEYRDDPTPNTKQAFWMKYFGATSIRYMSFKCGCNCYREIEINDGADEYYEEQILHFEEQYECWRCLNPKKDSNKFTQKEQQNAMQEMRIYTLSDLMKLNEKRKLNLSIDMMGVNFNKSDYD